MYQHGETVRSLAGRDEGQLLAVVKDDESGVWLADGKRRPLERLKCKNRRHIQSVGTVLDQSAMTTNRALRRALRAINERLTDTPVGNDRR